MRAVVKLRSVGGSLVMTIPVEVAKHLGWLVGDRVLLQSTNYGERLEELRVERDQDSGFDGILDLDLSKGPSSRLAPFVGEVNQLSYEDLEVAYKAAIDAGPEPVYFGFEKINS